MYANQNKVSGIDLADRQIKQKIYERYLQAFKKGAFNFIKEDEDPVTHQPIPRKYFSGGVVDLAQVTQTLHGDFAELSQPDQAAIATASGSIDQVTVAVQPGKIENIVQRPNIKNIGILTGGRCSEV